MLDAKRLREVLDYDPQTGAFTWKQNVARNVKAAQSAGNDQGTGGYLRIRIDKRLYAAHRLAWLFMTGVWPTNQIDHINQNRRDNRFVNLRDCPRQANSHNRRPAQPTQTCAGKWRIGITAFGKHIHLGTFATKSEAEAAYAAAKATLHLPVPGQTERNHYETL
jgi:hypothetical protein